MSWTLRLEALAGEAYRVTAQTKSTSDRQDTTTLSHAILWVEDSSGSTSVSGAKGTSSLLIRWA